MHKLNTIPFTLIHPADEFSARIGPGRLLVSWFTNVGTWEPHVVAHARWVKGHGVDSDLKVIPN